MPPVIPSAARNLPPFAKRKGARGMSCQPLNAETPTTTNHHSHHSNIMAIMVQNQSPLDGRSVLWIPASE